MSSTIFLKLKERRRPGSVGSGATAPGVWALGSSAGAYAGGPVGVAGDVGVLPVKYPAAE